MRKESQFERNKGTLSEQEKSTQLVRAGDALEGDWLGSDG
jgi:hypothetical protein